MFRFRVLCLLLLVGGNPFTHAQSTEAFADSIRRVYQLPAINYAVVSAEQVLEIHALGLKKAKSSLKAALSDQFRIGSNTKTITSYLAWQLVKQGKITWDTRFFDLYPELKAQSNPAYHAFTLRDLLTFRANLPSWTYTYDRPTLKEVSGRAQQQRYRFMAWILRQQPVAEQKKIYWSNPAYVAVGLMLEKVSGKEYTTLVTELGQSLGIELGFGQPNYKDPTQTWGHTEGVVPEKPADNHKLNWLSSAGNVKASLPDFVKFVQLHLQGLLGKSEAFTQAEFEQMHYGAEDFAFGWEWKTEASYRYSYHRGNPGSFLTKVYVYPHANRAFILFANIQSEQADAGLNVLLLHLVEQYNR